MLRIARLAKSAPSSPVSLSRGCSVGMQPIEAGLQGRRLQREGRPSSERAARTGRGRRDKGGRLPGFSWHEPEIRHSSDGAKASAAPSQDCSAGSGAQLTSPASTSSRCRDSEASSSPASSPGPRGSREARSRRHASLRSAGFFFSFGTLVSVVTVYGFVVVAVLIVPVQGCVLAEGHIPRIYSESGDRWYAGRPIEVTLRLRTRRMRKEKESGSTERQVVLYSRFTGT